MHQNYVGLDNDKSPFFLSIVLNEDNNTCVPLCRAILFKKMVSIFSQHVLLKIYLTMNLKNFLIEIMLHEVTQSKFQFLKYRSVEYLYLIF